jgi:phosphopantetheine--protein transferase-like protein
MHGPAWILTSWTLVPSESRDAWDASSLESGATRAVTGLGIDLESVVRFAGIAFGPSTAFAKRVFGPRERSMWHGAAAAALCFTAKEAIAKALGSGLCLRRGPGVPCQDIEVLVDLTTPRVTVELHDAAAARAAEVRALRGSVWCWCDATVACTVAVLLGRALDSARIDSALAEARVELRSDPRVRDGLVAHGRELRPS